MDWSALLSVAVAATITVPGSIPLGHATDGQKTGSLTIATTASGRAPFRETTADLAIDLPETANDDGSITSEGEGTTSFITLAERPSRPAYVTAMSLSCRLQAIVGSANKGTARLVVRFADGTAKPLRLRTAPKGWHYAGHMVGEFVRTSSRIVGVRAYDARGHALKGVQWGPDPTCA